MLGFRERKVFLLLVFDEGRKMWNEDNKEGNLVMLEIRWRLNLTKGMHGLGLPVGSDIELLKFPRGEKGLDDGLPTLPWFCKLSLSTIINQYIIVSTVIFGIYTILLTELQLSGIHYFFIS